MHLVAFYVGMRKLPPVAKPYHFFIWLSNKYVYSQIVRKVRPCP